MKIHIWVRRWNISKELDNFHKGELLIYQTEDGRTKIDVFLEDDTIWLNQKQISQLYQKGVNTINEHIKHIFEDGELEEKATIRKFRIVQKEGNREVSRDVDYYNLNMILAIGYRVRSHVGNQFRRWASEILTEYMKKGFAMNDERLKNPKKVWSWLFRWVRDIRASEKRFYQKIKDIYALIRNVGLERFAIGLWTQKYGSILSVLKRQILRKNWPLNSYIILEFNDNYLDKRR